MNSLVLEIKMSLRSMIFFSKQLNKACYCCHNLSRQLRDVVVEVSSNEEKFQQHVRRIEYDDTDEMECRHSPLARVWHISRLRGQDDCE